MKEKVRFLGLDVHAETIVVAVAERDGEVRSLGTIANRAESIRKLVKKLGPVEQLKACYEAGPTGYVLYWQLAELGVACEVIAPTLVPMKAGDRVKTDRRDAERLTAAEELLEIIMRRYERASTLLTSNRPVEDWGKLLGDSAAVSAMLDRLLHHGHVLKCGPRSWRTKTGGEGKSQ
jgi:hypothetical protein